MKNVKVRFELEIEEDGFPPISVETLNARVVNETTVELDNTPFFVESVAVGDILKCCRTDNDQVLEYEHVVTEGGNKSLSIIFVDDGFNMLAVSVSRNSDYENIRLYLDEKEKSGVISYAELCL